MGYYIYGELENSDSYYVNHPGVEQTLIQASFEVDLSDNLRIQFGGMYHITRALRMQAGTESHKI